MEAPVIEAAPAGPLRILIVEDHAAVAMLERRSLESAGCIVDVVGTGAAALALSKATDLDAIVLDQHLPDMAGLEVLEALGRGARMPPVVMVTGCAEAALAVAALKAGAADYLVKDTNLSFVEGLPRVVRAVVERSRITAHNQRLQDALHRSEERFRRLVEQINVLPWEFDWDSGRFTYVGPQAEAFSGYPPDAWTAENFWVDHIHPEEREEILHACRVASERDEDHSLEYRMICADGSMIWIQDIVTVETLPGGDKVLRGVLMDITDRKREEAERLALERRMQEAQLLESLGVLAGGVAHDFNNLLTGILANAELSLLDLPAQSPVRECVETIREAGLHAADLTRQMLNYAGKGQFVFDPLDLATLVDGMDRLLLAALPKRVALQTQFRDTPVVQADAGQMRQVILNLVINAGEAMDGADGTVSLSTGHLVVGELDAERMRVAAGDYAYLEVADNGVGMDAATVARIFDPFFTTKFLGRGLGLAAVAGIVRSHGGALTVDSELGRGSTFKALFPAV